MGDLISRKALIDYLDETVADDEMLVSQYNADWIYSFIESAPSVDAVEVVRCRDCKHMEWYFGEMTCPYYDDRCVDANHFCSYGERKEKGDGEC